MTSWKRRKKVKTLDQVKVVKKKL